MRARAHTQAHTRGPSTLFLPRFLTGNLCDFNLLHPSFPAGFLTESLLRGLVVCAWELPGEYNPQGQGEAEPEAAMLV